MSDSSTAADQTVLELYAPRLPLATEPVIGADCGVPLHIYDLDPMGCKVEVGPYVGQQPGDTVSISLNGEPNLDVGQTQSLNDAVTLYIPHHKLWHGNINRLTYTAKRGSANLDTSVPLEILYNSIRPGNQDRTPGDGEHSELELLLPDEIKHGVGPGFTQATVCVSYPYCRAHDRIWLNCNGNPVYHMVTETEGPPPPEHGSATPTMVCFEVTSADLGNDHAEFKFSFTVNDQLNNSPDPNGPWSAVQTVDVDQAGNRLPEPIPREIASDAGDDPSTIDLGKLGANPLLLIVLTDDSRFAAGDTIEATYVAKMVGQQDVVVTVTGTVEVNELGQKVACVFEIPNDKVIPGSTVQASYKLFRNTQLQGSSRTARATVVGQPVAELKIDSLTASPHAAAHNFLVDSGFPETRFIGAKFRLNISGGMLPYTYSSSSSLNVIDWTGVVTIGDENGATTFTVKDSIGNEMPFLMPEGKLIFSVPGPEYWGPEGNWALNPTRAEFTSGKNARQVGSLFGEWGDLHAGYQWPIGAKEMLSGTEWPEISQYWTKEESGGSHEYHFYYTVDIRDGDIFDSQDHRPDPWELHATMISRP